MLTILSWLLDMIPRPETRMLITRAIFVRYLLPPVLSHYATAILVQLPHTFPIRLALLPISLWLNFTASTRVDLVGDDRNVIWWNQDLMIMMVIMGCRDIIWTFAAKPPKRLRHVFGDASAGPTSESDSDNDHRSLSRIAVDAFDLMFNLRGIGWTWPQDVRLVLPPLPRPTLSRSAFAMSLLLSFTMWFISFDITSYCIQLLGPDTFGSNNGGTIFDLSLPPVQRYLRSSLVTLLFGLRMIPSMPLIHNMLALLAILLFRQEPWQWPPVFEEPWLSTSLIELWGTRWHQLFRECFVQLGAVPGALIFGHAGGVMGGFLISGLLHHFGTWAMGYGSEFVSVTGFFLAMGLGNVLEYTFKKVTGRRVQGWWGRTWMFFWLIGWGNIVVDSWAKAGFLGCQDIPPNMSPSVLLFGPVIP